MFTTTEQFQFCDSSNQDNSDSDPITVIKNNSKFTEIFSVFAAGLVCLCRSRQATLKTVPQLITWFSGGKCAEFFLPSRHFPINFDECLPLTLVLWATKVFHTRTPLHCLLFWSKRRAQKCTNNVCLWRTNPVGGKIITYPHYPHLTHTLDPRMCCQRTFNGRD